MIRTATPTHELVIPLDPEVIADIWVTYKQGEEIICEIRKDKMSNKGNLWFYKLTQEQTKKFCGCSSVRIQAKVLTTGSDVFVSDVFRKTVEDVLNDEVMT